MVGIHFNDFSLREGYCPIVGGFKERFRFPGRQVGNNRLNKSTGKEGPIIKT